METLLLVLALMTGAVFVVAIGERATLPWPALMVLLGIVVTLTPGLPDELRIDPALILPLFLPPMLFATAQRTTWAQCRARWRSLLGLAVLLVIATATAAAAVAWWLTPGMGFATAMLLGALVSPPDPVAVEAVAGPLGIPRRVLATLQTEGLFNDATAIVLFHLALSATLSDTDFDVVRAVVTFVVSAAAAVAIGVALAYAARLLLRVVTSTAGAGGLSLVLPFVVYVVAEEVHASGVVAVVAAALQFRETRAADASTQRLSHRALWDVVELLVTGVAFGLIGLEMRRVFTDAGERLPAMLGVATAVAATTVVVRFAWLFTASRVIIARGARGAAPRTGREAVAMSWCGMRGLATLALALSLPVTTNGQSWFPYRDEIVLTAATVILVTLVLAGLSLPRVLLRLGVTRDAAEERVAEKKVRRLAHAAALAELDLVRRDIGEELPPAVAQAAGKLLDRIADSLTGDPADELSRAERERLRHKRRLMTTVNARILAAARQAVIDARRDPTIDPEAAERILERLDLRTALGD